jgi:hypothetical protein
LRTRQAETAALARRSLRSRDDGLLVFEIEAEAPLRELIAALAGVDAESRVERQRASIEAIAKAAAVTCR